MTFRLTCLAMVMSAVISTGDATAQDTKSDRAATVDDATKVLDLGVFPVMTGAKCDEPRRMASLSYTAKSEVREAYAFQKKTLEEQGWKELPGGYLSDQSCSGSFGKDGFTVSVSASPGFGPDAAGLVNVMLNNHGNIDVAKLPVPPNSKLLYSFPTATAYVTETPTKETAEAIRKLLTARGWQPYGTAGDSQFFKNNAIRLTATAGVAPAQGGKTVIQLATEQLSADLPAPPALLNGAYADTTKALSIDVDMTPDALVAFYREVLGKAGWKPTTERPVKIDFRDMMIFRNDAKDIATLKMQKVNGKLRATLDHQNAAEFAEAMKRAEAEETARKAKSAAYAKMAAEAAAKNRVSVVIGIPNSAKDIERTKDSLEFKLAAGKAKDAVVMIRADLLKHGWKTSTESLEPIAGTVVLKKKSDLIVTITYVDAGVEDAQVTISTFGVEIDVPNEK